ncbi:MAG TPA: mechanosensitive ion channel family protein [Candidatus Polarisedimenticolia bacterium]|nr:mechanosensitive ion channel family protein [Candidatus Polarisedimenticolia bacterium]
MDLSGILLLPWAYAPLLSLAAVLALLLFKRRLFGLASRMASRTATGLDDVILSAAGPPLNLLIVASGILLADRLLPLTEETDRIMALLYRICLIAGFIWFIDRLARQLLNHYAERFPFLSQARGVVQGIVRGLFFGLGVLILLDSLGISITPLLASLGVGSLAVALALQSTLANMFAGLHLLADKAIEAGQFIRLDSGLEGEVERIGWRSTRIRTPASTTLIVPNSKLGDSVIINFDQPYSQTTITVPVGVHYLSDLSRVEKITLEVAAAVMREVEGGVPGFQPSLRYTAFADSAVTCNVLMRVSGFRAQPLVQHEFLKRLHERYRAEGIQIPYPTRTLDLPPQVVDRMKHTAAP